MPTDPIDPSTAPTEQEAPKSTRLTVAAVHAINVIDDIVMGNKLSATDIAWLRRVLKRWDRKLDELN